MSSVKRTTVKTVPQEVSKTRQWATLAVGALILLGIILYFWNKNKQPSLSFLAMTDVVPASNGSVTIPNPTGIPPTNIAQLASGIDYGAVTQNCDAPIIGCMDSAALNFNPQATVNNGQCTYRRFGCTNSESTTYDRRANANLPGLCTLPQPKVGCTREDALNRDPAAVIADNRLCVLKRPGCTSIFSPSFDPNANVDDGSCVPWRLGCTDPASRSFDPNATINSKFCWGPRPGCMDQQSATFDWRAQVQDPASCCGVQPNASKCGCAQ